MQDWKGELKLVLNIDRKIIHIDMDAFFASVEQRDNPELKGKPVAVGGNSKRGVVAAASYEARKFGVRSAMSSVIAAQKCPQLIFVNSNFEAYKKVSKQIREIFLEYTDLIEPLSLDEAYLDVTENKKGMKSAIQIAKEIKQKIFETTKLTASAGISNSKFVAKIASDFNKPDGLTFVKPENIIPFIEQLDIDKFHGIGKVTASKMKAKGIFTGLDLKKYSEIDLTKSFGKAGKYYYNICRGIDNRKVQPTRVRKSIAAERTFEYNLTEIPQMEEALEEIAEILYNRIEKAQVQGKTLTIKIKYADFTICTRSQTVSFDVFKKSDIVDLSNSILLNTDIPNKAIRLLGISLTNFKKPEKPIILSKQLKFDFT